jgi:hypothetical protein
MDRTELEALSSRELHDKAVGHAVRHLNVGFLWDLVSAVPAAEASAGHLGEAKSDVVSLTSLLTDVLHSGDEKEVTNALRPLYIDYLEKHA